MRFTPAGGLRGSIPNGQRAAWKGRCNSDSRGVIMRSYQHDCAAARGAQGPKRGPRAAVCYPSPYT